MKSACCVVLNSNCGAPVTPRLVKIWITPAEASVPNRVAAAAPFSTSIRSMLFGLRSLSRLEATAAFPVVGERKLSIRLSTRTPST